LSLPLFSATKIALLLKPEVYPHSVRELVLLETHISWVILTGDFAYKIKKPCKFNFVDYSTLELRHGYCLKELEYNRRLAAQLYLDVVPICENTDGSLQIKDSVFEREAECEPIEYAVKMKQFPQDAILTSRVAHHELTPDAIEEFGEDLARFHESIESVNPSLECVQSSHIRQDAIDNILTLKDGLPRDSNLQPILDSLTNWTEEEFVRREPIFQSRLLNGDVRRCHGDMHLNNLIQIDRKVMAFDCIEFNEEFQWIDVLSDVAFPVMDFMTKGRTDLAWRLLNAYLEVREDWRGLEVFRFYAVYRALVRAKVTWLDPSKHVSMGMHHGALSETGPWEQYIHTAARLAFPKPCKLAITYGLSGSGKSRKALEYVAERGSLLVRSDIERKRILKSLEPSNPYSVASRERVYERLYHLAKLLLGWNYSVVVDATFLKQEMRHKFQSLASNMHAPLDIIACEASIEELERRILQRQGDASDATLDVLQGQLAENEPLTDAERSMVIEKGIP
jgi:uncharacterized protein